MTERVRIARVRRSFLFATALLFQTNPRSFSEAVGIVAANLHIPLPQQLAVVVRGEDAFSDVEYAQGQLARRLATEQAQEIVARPPFFGKTVVFDARVLCPAHTWPTGLESALLAVMPSLNSDFSLGLGCLAEEANIPPGVAGIETSAAPTRTDRTPARPLPALEPVRPTPATPSPIRLAKTPSPAPATPGDRQALTSRGPQPTDVGRGALRQRRVEFLAEFLRQIGMRYDRPVGIFLFCKRTGLDDSIVAACLDGRAHLATEELKRVASSFPGQDWTVWGTDRSES